MTCQVENTYADGENWPKSPKALTQRLKVLHTNEIKVGFRRLGTARLITFAKGGDTFGDTSEAELVTPVDVAEVTDKSTVAQNTQSGGATKTPPLETPRRGYQAPHVDCHKCIHSLGRENPNDTERGYAIKKGHFPTYGWRPCSGFEQRVG
jgi:hypothetical protein